VIEVNIWTKGQSRHVEMPAYQLEIEGAEIWMLANALEEIAKAIRGASKQNLEEENENDK